MNKLTPQIIVEALDNVLLRESKAYPCHINRASAAGSDCERQLYLMRTRWEEQLLPELDLLYIFREGNYQEELVLNDLRKAGFQLIEQQRAYSWREYELTGHIDAIILYEGRRYMGEIKSMSDNIYKRINHIDDMVNSPYPWVKKYPAQQLLYQVMGNALDGFFLLKNKTTGRIKPIELDANPFIDSGYIDRILERLVRVNEAIKTGVEPPRYFDDGAVERRPYCPNECDMCSYKHICLIGVDLQQGSAPEWDGDDVKAAKLEEYYELSREIKELKSKHNKLDKEVTALSHGHTKLICKNFALLGKRTKTGWKKEVIKIESS